MATQKEYLRVMRERYKKAGKQEKGSILSEVCTLLNIHRKSAIRRIGREPLVRAIPRSPRYIYGLDLQKPLELIWVLLGKPCSKRLRPQIGAMIEKLDSCRELKLTGTQKAKLGKMSTWTMDQLLVERREMDRFEQGISGTKRSPLLKTLIPIHTEWTSRSKPGQLEIDCVLHCGSSLFGTYAETINMLDIATHWNEKRMILKKNKAKVVACLHESRRQFPFPLQSVDFDNGGEFVNWKMYTYCEREKIGFTRSRSYRKNDQAHIEGKNFESVRRVVGYGRIEDKTMVEMWNDVYLHEHRLLTNFFYPTMKLTEKKRKGVRIMKKYGEAQTPYQRVLASNEVSESVKDVLRSQYKKLNPRILHDQMQKKLKHIQNYMQKITVTVSNQATSPKHHLVR